MKQKLLFCISPVTPLVKHYAFVDMQLGAGLIREGIDEELFDVEYIDLNAWLHNQRDEKPLFDFYDFFLLLHSYTSTAVFPALYGYNNRIERALECLIESIPKKQYDYILFSVPLCLKNSLIVMVSINFTFILARRFKSLFGSKIIVGGGGFDFIPKDMLREICIRHLSQAYVDYLFYSENAISSLPILLHRLFYGKSSIGIADVTFKDCKAIYKHRTFTSISKDLSVRLLPREPFRKLLGKSFFAKIKTIDSMRKKNSLRGELATLPDFNVSNFKQYGIDINNTFKLSRYLPSYSTDHSCSVRIYPIRFMKGCPYMCTFCVQGLFAFSCLSPIQAVDYIERVLDEYQDARYFRFINCQINVSVQYALAFADEIIRRRLNIFFIDSANLREPSLEVFDALRKAGCIKLWFGLESLSSSILSRINKNITVDMICKGVELAHQSGIWAGGNLITGFPNESEEDHRCNIEFVRGYNGKINCWEIRPFSLYQHTPDYYLQYDMQPHKKNIFFDQSIPFEEVGKRNHYARKNILSQRFNDFKEVIPAENFIFDNDYLLFYLLDQYRLTKEQTYEAMKRYAFAIREDDVLTKSLSLERGFDYNLHHKVTH